MLAVAKKLASRLAPILCNPATPKRAFRLAFPSRTKTDRAQEQLTSPPDVDTIEAQVAAGVRLLSQADAEIPPYIAKHLVGKDGKIIEEMKPFYGDNMPMWGPAGPYKLS